MMCGRYVCFCFAANHLQVSRWKRVNVTKHLTARCAHDVTPPHSCVTSLLQHARTCFAVGARASRGGTSGQQVASQRIRGEVHDDSQPRFHSQCRLLLLHRFDSPPLPTPDPHQHKFQILSHQVLIIYINVTLVMTKSYFILFFCSRTQLLFLLGC